MKLQDGAYFAAAVLAGVALWRLYSELQRRKTARPVGGTTDDQARANREQLARELQQQPDFWI